MVMMTVIVTINDIDIIISRYLQTLNSISAEKNSTIIFPLPMELVGAFTDSDHGELILIINTISITYIITTIIIVTNTEKNITNIIITVIFILTKQLTRIPLFASKDQIFHRCSKEKCERLRGLKMRKGTVIVRKLLNILHNFDQALPGTTLKC